MVRQIQVSRRAAEMNYAIREVAVPAAELAKKYGSFKLDGWYTTGADTADIWPSATEPRFVYDSLDRVCYTGTEYVATLSTREQDLIRNAVESSLRATGAFANDADMLAAVENAVNGHLCDLEDCVNWQSVLTGGDWKTGVPYPDFDNDYENF